jgi:hypothetical protein
MVMVTLATGTAFLLFTCMHLWVWGVLRRWAACALTACEVVRCRRKVEKLWSGCFLDTMHKIRAICVIRLLWSQVVKASEIGLCERMLLQFVANSMKQGKCTNGRKCSKENGRLMLMTYLCVAVDCGMCQVRDGSVVISGRTEEWALMKLHLTWEAVMEIRGSRMACTRGLQLDAREALPSDPRNKSRPRAWFCNQGTITRDVQMCKFFERPPESSVPFLELPEFWKQQPESVSPLPWGGRMSEKIR